MDIQTHLREHEQTHCRATVEYGDTYTDGELACTDRRLLLARENRLLDIDLDSIHEISYRESAIPWEYIGAAVLFVLLGVLSVLLPPELLSVSLQFPIIVFAMVATVVSVYEAYRYRRPTLVVTTPTQSHTFRGAEIEQFPNTIRTQQHSEQTDRQ